MPQTFYNDWIVAYVAEIGYCVMQAGKGTRDRVVHTTIATCPSEDKAFEILDALSEMDRGD